MPINRRFCRVILEMEFEVTDETALTAHLFDWTHDDNGEPVMMGPDEDYPGAPGTSQQNRVARAAMDALVEGVRNMPLGIRFMGGSSIVRPITPDNVYQQVTVPALPARNDDGSSPAGW